MAPTPLKIVEGVVKFPSYPTTTWETNNPKLPLGHIGIDTTRKAFKIGDGVTRWKDLEYFTSGGIPIGGLLWHTSKTAPSDFLAPTGALLSRTTYSDLFDFANKSGIIVSDAAWLADKKYTGFYSTGNGTSTFRIPLLDDITIEAWTTATGNNDGRVAGSYQYGTVVGASYMVNVAGPAAQRGIHGVALQKVYPNGSLPAPPAVTSKSPDEYEVAAEKWFKATPAYKTTETKQLPTNDQVAAKVHIDPVTIPGYVPYYTVPVITGNDDEESFVSTTGMTRPETIAYPVFIRYK